MPSPARPRRPSGRPRLDPNSPSIKCWYVATKALATTLRVVAAKRHRGNVSSLVRQALHEYLLRIAIVEPTAPSSERTTGQATRGQYQPGSPS